jgi:HK97 family phage prohead protease
MDHLFLETKIAVDDAGAISGVAWKFATPDRVGDMIEPGAFKGVTLPLPMLFGHDMADPVGTWDTATEKADGFYLTGKLLVDQVARAREVRALVQAGAVKGLSIGFLTKKAVSRPGGGRTIKSLDLFEVSLVTVGMHPGARVTSAKSAVEALNLVAMLNRAATALTKGPTL